MAEADAAVEATPPVVVQYDPLTGVPPEFNNFLPPECAEFKRWKAAQEGPEALAALTLKDKEGNEIEKVGGVLGLVSWGVLVCVCVCEASLMSWWCVLLVPPLEAVMPPTSISRAAQMRDSSSESPPAALRDQLADADCLRAAVLHPTDTPTHPTTQRRCCRVAR
jgi:hypothetical protein